MASKHNMITQLNTPKLTGNSVAAKRQELKAYFENTWSTYESLFALISQEKAYFLRPEPLRHPLIFYFGHTATFYVNKLMLGRFITDRIDDRIEAICAVGVDEMSWDDLDSTHYDWPSVKQVSVYRKQVFQLVSRLIDTMELSLPIQQDSLAWIILMGCEHERIHLETSSVIMRMLPLEYLTTHKNWQPCSNISAAPENILLAVKSRNQILGKKTHDDTFGWDNEYGKLNVSVAAFCAAKYLVSNQEYMGFVKEGGYQEKRFWCQEGQAWLAYTRAQAPRFWCYRNGQYYQRNLTSEIALPLNWPVEVNCLEAKAFCQWKQEHTEGFVSLPTEAQWYCLLDDAVMQQKQNIVGNINLTFQASPCPVDQYQQGRFFDVMGNVWQWTNSVTDGFPGFSVHPLYDDFSTPTFDGQHNLIKGGSWVSTGNETLASSRYAFRRHFYQHAGFRYVVNEEKVSPSVQVNKFETNRDICQQLACYFESHTLGFENYGLQVANCVKILLNDESINNKRLLNLGCSVGRVAFELSTHFQHIDAVDFSARMIRYGVQLQTGARVRYTHVIEGDICQYNEITLADTVKQVKTERIRFSQGDGCNLKANFTSYDVVLIQHALEQSYDPKRLLTNAINSLNANGVLIIVSDYHYQAANTEKNKWLSGIKVNAENLTGFNALIQLLGSEFELINDQELTRVEANTVRNFNVALCQLTVWRKNKSY